MCSSDLGKCKLSISMRLTFFGDSFTYGIGFDDCHTPKDPPSKKNWVSQVVAHMNCEHRNLANPGSSNQQIFYNIRLYDDYQKDEIIIVQWSFSSRDMIMTEHGPDMIGLWGRDVPIMNYFHLHPDIDLERRSAMTIEHTALWLQNRNIPYLFFANDKFSSISIDELISDYQSNHRIMDCHHAHQSGCQLLMV